MSFWWVENGSNGGMVMSVCSSFVQEQVSLCPAIGEHACAPQHASLYGQILQPSASEC